MPDEKALSEYVADLRTTLASPPAGWFVFGTHVDQPDVPLEFWGDDGGVPFWERPVPAGAPVHPAGTYRPTLRDRVAVPVINAVAHLASPDYRATIKAALARGLRTQADPVTMSTLEDDPQLLQVELAYLARVRSMNPSPRALRQIDAHEASLRARLAAVLQTP